MTLTPEVARAAEAVVAALTAGGIPEGDLFDRVIDAGIEIDDYKAARRHLMLGTQHISYKKISLHTGQCIACGQVTPYRSGHDLGPLCPGCVSPDSVWTWKAAPPRSQRKTSTIRVSRRPTGWTHSGSSTGHQACNSIFDRLVDGRPNCADLTTWRVEEIRGRTTYTSWWCDADLPAERHPEANHAERLQ